MEDPLGYSDKEMGERACAFVVLRPGKTITLEEITQFLLKKKLAKFKLPERLNVVEALPTVGDSGKIDKMVLKTELEKKVAQEGIRFLLYRGVLAPDQAET